MDRGRIGIAMSKGPKRLSESPRRFQWTDELVELLGKIPDTEVAQRAGVSCTTVLAERQRRGLPSFDRRRPRFEWTPDAIALLGRDTDVHVAEELDVHPVTVARKRRILGIPSYVDRSGRATSARTWTPEEISALGTEPDRAIAERLGISASCVTMKRLILGIPPWHTPPDPVDWSADRVGLLGVIPDLELARRLNTTPRTVRKRRESLGIPPFSDKQMMYERTGVLETLLELPDQDIKRRTGMCQTTVYKLRAEYGVPPPEVESSRWTPEVLARLGKEPDAHIARDLGLTPCGVAVKRYALGISSSRRDWTEPEVAALGTAPDREVAEELGRSIRAVRSKRHVLKIPRHE
jgi:hypothetical protein